VIFVILFFIALRQIGTSTGEKWAEKIAPKNGKYPPYKSENGAVRAFYVSKV
jgi:hypothetical protein